MVSARNFDVAQLGDKLRPALFSIPGKWSLASRPVLSFRRQAYRRPAPDRPECQTLRACPARSEFSILQTCPSQSEQACPPQSAGSFDHNKRGDHLPSVLIGIARFGRPKPAEPPMSDGRTQSGWLPTRPKRSEFSSCSCPFQSACREADQIDPVRSAHFLRTFEADDDAN
jgi:hypothetical protein